MSAKTTTNRTSLSLNAGIKQTNKPNEQNDNTKKDSLGSNQKTETSNKKDVQQEKKQSSTDKKYHAMAEGRKPSTSSDNKRSDDSKNAKEENKKNQNGVSSTNGVSNKNKATEETKPKEDNHQVSSSGSGSGSSTPKRGEAQKAEKKKEAPAKVVVNDEKKVEDSKKEQEKEKVSDDNLKKDKKREKQAKQDVAEKKADEKKSDEKKSGDKKSDEKKSDEKKSDEKLNDAKSTEVEKSAKGAEIIDLDSSDEEMAKEPVAAENKKAEVVAKSPKKVDEASKAETQKVQPAEELEDVEMEHLPAGAELSHVTAASTPAKSRDDFRLFGEALKTSPRSEVKPPKPQPTYTPDRKSCPRSFSAISGRRSIRPMGDYTLSSGNLQIRESYRKINTELDFTNSSLNVTVGSEVPNDSSFSFFSRSRKRDRSSPVHQSTMEVQGDISPPKRPRIDLGVSGFFSAVASPISMLRARFARTTVQSTPKKSVELPRTEEDVVENVSGVSIEEELTATEDLTVNPDVITDSAVIADEQQPIEEPAASMSEKPAIAAEKYDDIKVKETFTDTAALQGKKKCSIM